MKVQIGTYSSNSLNESNLLNIMEYISKTLKTYPYSNQYNPKGANPLAPN